VKDTSAMYSKIIFDITVSYKRIFRTNILISWC